MSSLAQLLERPEVWASFQTHARMDVPAPRAGISSRACDPVLSGWALAYLCQFEAARWAHAHQAPVAQAGWVAQMGLHNLRHHPCGQGHAPEWQTWMEQQALPLASRYVAGDTVHFRQLATVAWRLAHLDSLCRLPSPSWDKFKALPSPRAEHLTQLSRWWRKWRLGLPRCGAPVILNADVAAAGCVRHGESALIVGDTLLATRVLKEANPASWAHRLAGQAAWLEKVGTHGTLGTWPIRHVRICFVRWAGRHAWVGWDLENLFDDEGWSNYGEAILRAAHR